MLTLEACGKLSNVDQPKDASAAEKTLDPTFSLLNFYFIIVDTSTSQASIVE